MEEQVPYPFVLPEERRELITLESEPPGDRHDPRQQDQDWVGSANQGRGEVPEDFFWRSNPRQEQELSSCG